MKKSFLSIATLSLLMLLASCNNLLNQENQNNQADRGEKGSFVISLNLQAQPSVAARTVSPTGDKTYLDVEEWEFTCTDQDDPAFVIKETFPVEEGKIKAALPLGHVYDVVLAGALQNEVDEKVVFTNKTPVEIDLKNQESITAPVYVTVDLAKTPTGEGNLHYVVTMAGDLSGKTPSYMLRLCEPGTEGRVVLYQYTSSTGDSEKDIEDGEEKDKAYILSYSDGVLEIDFAGKEHKIKSGFYDLYIYQSGDSNDFTAGKRIFTGENLIEIADGITTFANVTGTVLKRKTFYATIEPSEYSGNSPSYPININTLLSKLDDYQDEEIDIKFVKNTDLRTAKITLPTAEELVNKPYIYAYIENRAFYKGGTYYSELTVSENGNDNTVTEQISAFKTVGGAMNFISSYLPSAKVAETDLCLNIEGAVSINEDNRCYISDFKSITIKGNDKESDSINGNKEGKYYPDGNGLCLSNMETINVSNVAIKNILGGTDRASSQCAGLRFDGTSNIKNVNLTGCTFSGNTKGSVGESILIIDGTTTPITVSIKNCDFNGNGITGSNGNTTSGVIKVLDANVNMTIESCTFTGNGKPDLNISADKTHDYEPVVTIKNTSFSRLDNSANIVYKTGKLNLEGTIPATIQVGNGRTVNLRIAINENTITLVPENYAQSAPILTVAEGLDFETQKEHFVLEDDGYSINSDGFIEGDYLKHITPTNYESFTKDDLAEDMTLVIHSGVPSDKLRDFFMSLDNSANSESPITITIDLSGYDSDLETSGLAYLFDSINVICVILPDNMTSINDQLFESANTLREIKIAASNSNYVTENGILYKKNGNEKTEIIKYPQAKEGESFTLPETVTAAAYGAFEQTINLKTIPNFNIVTELNDMNIFKYSSVTDLVLNDSITTIPYYTFEESKIENITLPANLISIGANSFCYCSQLRTVTFRNANPPEMTEANDLTEFAECPNLEQINVPGTDLSVVSAYQAALPEAVRSKVALYLPTGDSINVTEALTDGFIITPESYDYSYPIVTFAVGLDSTNFKKIHLSDPDYHIDETGRIASALRKTVTSANWESEFGSWSELTEGMTLVIDSSMAADVEVAEDVTSPVATEFFKTLENNYKDLTLDLSSYRADSYSELSFMNGAVKVILPDTLEDLYSDAFEIERQLKEIVISESNPNYVTIDGVLYKKDASGNPSVLVRYPPAKFAGSFTLPSTVTSIGSAVFANASILNEVTNFNQITKCESSSMNHFRGTTGITSIELSEDFTELATAMFRESGLYSITIPAGVIKINANCFESCSNLTEITFMGSVPPVIGDDAFLGCEGLTDIYVPASAVGDYKDVLPEELKENVRAN